MLRVVFVRLRRKFASMLQFAHQLHRYYDCLAIVRDVIAVDSCQLHASVYLKEIPYLLMTHNSTGEDDHQSPINCLVIANEPILRDCGRLVSSRLISLPKEDGTLADDPQFDWKG